MFRNESTSVIDKAKSREKNKAKARAKLEAATPSSTTTPRSRHTHEPLLDNEDSELNRFHLDPQQVQHLKLLIPSAQVFPTINERALGYFVTHSSAWLRNFDLVDAICSPSHVDKHLLASMSAVGLASFSSSAHAPQLMIRAQRDYVKALQLTNAALKSPSEVKKDSTLLAVMILGIFETVAGSNGKSLAAWAEHINGAAALVKLRGEEQFNSQAGKRMFLQVTSNLMLSCIQRTIPMPEHMVVLHKSAESFMDTENPAWQLSSIIIDFTIFRAAIQNREIVGPRAIISELLDLDQRFIAVFENLPEEWRYQIIYTDENPHLIWNGRYHVYKEFWIAHIWNGMRTCRIIVHETIQDQLLLASSALEPPFTASESLVQNQASEDIMIQMRDDILGSVAHHTQASTPPSMGILEGSRTYFVLWPLYLAGAMKMTTPSIRQWAITRLRDIAETAGLRQALVIAEYLISRKHIAAFGPKATVERKKSETTARWEKESHLALASGLREFTTSVDWGISEVEE